MRSYSITTKLTWPYLITAKLLRFYLIIAKLMRFYLNIAKLMCFQQKKKRFSTICLAVNKVSCISLNVFAKTHTLLWLFFFFFIFFLGRSVPMPSEQFNAHTIVKINAKESDLKN